MQDTDFLLKRELSSLNEEPTVIIALKHIPKYKSQLTEFYSFWK